MGWPVISTSVFLDKHATYKSTANPSIQNECECNNRTPLSKFEKALKELRQESLRSNSLEAKGRKEKAFRTPPDRLVTEMR